MNTSGRCAVGVQRAGELKCSVGKVPQDHGLVRAAGGEGASVGGERQREHRASVAGEGLAEAMGLGAVGEVP